MPDEEVDSIGMKLAVYQRAINSQLFAEIVDAIAYLLQWDSVMPPNDRKHMQFAQIGKGKNLSVHIGRPNDGFEQFLIPRGCSVGLSETPRFYRGGGQIKDASRFAGLISGGVENWCPFG